MTVSTFLLNSKTFLICLFLLSITIVVVEAGYLIWTTSIDSKRHEKLMVEVDAIERCVGKVRQSIHALYAEMGRLLDEQERRAANYVAGINAKKEESARLREGLEKLHEYFEQVCVEHGVVLVAKGEAETEKEVY